MLCPWSPDRKEGLLQLNYQKMDSSIINTDEDLITFSPTPKALDMSLIKQEPSKPTFVEGLLGHIHKAHSQALSEASIKDDPFVDDSDEDDDPYEHQRLLNTPVGPRQQDRTSPSDVAPRLLQQSINSTSSSTSKSSNNFTGSSTRDLCTNTSNSLHDSQMANSRPIREAPFPFISSPGCIVTIHNLPYDISMRDILARVRGGEIRNATLVKLRKAMCAVITFKEARSAQQFVHASESFEDEIWTFNSAEEGEDPKKAQIAYVPTLDTTKVFNDPFDIPIEPRHSMELDLATRCLAITDCSFELIEEIWKSLRLPCHLHPSHCIDQFEDIWLDGFQRGEDGQVESTTIHIWYTSTRMAFNAKNTIKGKPWSINMRFEADPCNDTPSVLFFRESDDAGFAWHSNPNHSLMDVYKAGCISELFSTWCDISQAVKRTRAAPPTPDESPKLLPSEDMAARNRAALTNGGFDPVTLISRSTQDYDSDEEGGRGPPRIDTRKIEAQRVAMRQKQAEGPLLSPTACLTALVDLANKAPSTTIYSPGTSRKHEHEYDQHANYCSVNLPDKQNRKIDESPRDVSFTPPDKHSSKAGDLKTPEWSDPDKNPAYSDENLESLRKAFKERTDWYTVSVEEFVACNELQHKTMGTAFYIPPKGHNSLKWYSLKEE